MHHRIAAIFIVLCFALGEWSCASKSKSGYDEVLMPLQTGSVLHRRVEVRATEEKKPKPNPTTKKKPATPKPEEEPSATPAPEEESTPPPDRFR